MVLRFNRLCRSRPPQYQHNVGTPKRRQSLAQNIHKSEYVPGSSIEYKLGKNFITALPGGSRESFRFAVYGDNDDHLPVVQSMASYAPDFLLGVGDYSYDGNDLSDIYNFFREEKDLLSNYPFVPAYGNYEFNSGNSTGNTLMDSFFIPQNGGNFAY